MEEKLFHSMSQRKKPQDCVPYVPAKNFHNSTYPWAPLCFPNLYCMEFKVSHTLSVTDKISRLTDIQTCSKFDFNLLIYMANHNKYVNV